MKKALVITVITVVCSLLLVGNILSLPKGAITAQSAETRKLTVIMYHNIKNSVKGRYVVSCEQFENDLIAFEKEGYETVFPSEIIKFSQGKGSLPEKPLLLTFDDGYYNNMAYALPLLKKYNAKAVLNVIGAFSEYSTSSGDHSNANYSHVTWSQVGELSRSGCFEIGNHTYNMHKFSPRFGVGKLQSENEETYRTALINDIGRLQTKLELSCGYKPVVFAYPFGKMTPISNEVIMDMGFLLTLSCCEKSNTITYGDPDSIIRLNRYNREGSYSTEKLIGIMAKNPKKQSER